MAGNKKKSAAVTSCKPTKPGPYASGHEGGAYHIRVAGRLDASWSERTGGMTMVVHDAGGLDATTELRGPVQDQAALMGILDQFYVLGVHVLKVERLGTGSGARKDKDQPGRHQRRRAIK